MGGAWLVKADTSGTVKYVMINEVSTFLWLKYTIGM